MSETVNIIILNNKSKVGISSRRLFQAQRPIANVLRDHYELTICVYWITAVTSVQQKRFVQINIKS